MSRAPRPLTPDEAKNTLAARLGDRLAPKLRQLATKFGVRPTRCFLVWTLWSGRERGEGDEREVRRIELLPTPKVENMDAVAFSLLAAGTLPVGSVRLSKIATTYTYDQLKGLVVPVEHEDHVPERYSFYYELMEDGRGDPLPVRTKFRPASVPFRRAGKVDWTIILEREGQDNLRTGASAALTGVE